MERLFMNCVREVLRRLRAGESELRIAKDPRIARMTMHKYGQRRDTSGWRPSESHRIMRRAWRWWDLCPPAPHTFTR